LYGIFITLVMFNYSRCALITAWLCRKVEMVFCWTCLCNCQNTEQSKDKMLCYSGTYIYNITGINCHGYGRQFSWKRYQENGCCKYCII